MGPTSKSASRPRRSFPNTDAGSNRPALRLAAWGRTNPNSDGLGLRAVESPVPVHDFRATILHLMGFDHEKLTCRHAGLDFRLTGVEGANVVKEVLA